MGESVSHFRRSPAALGSPPHHTHSFAPRDQDKASVSLRTVCSARVQTGDELRTWAPLGDLKELGPGAWGQKTKWFSLICLPLCTCPRAPIPEEAQPLLTEACDNNILVRTTWKTVLGLAICTREDKLSQAPCCDHRGAFPGKRL